ncbi:hypothetical protein ACLOJK_003504, partial [Asimina triloba]
MIANDEEGDRNSPLHRRWLLLIVAGEDVHQTEDDALSLLNGSDLALERSPEHIDADSSEEDGAPCYGAPVVHTIRCTLSSGPYPTSVSQQWALPHISQSTVGLAPHPSISGGPYPTSLSQNIRHSVEGVRVLRSGSAIVKDDFTSVYISLAHMCGG